jgi:predicted transposase YdaD
LAWHFDLSTSEFGATETILAFVSIVAWQWSGDLRLSGGFAAYGRITFGLRTIQLVVEPKRRAKAFAQQLVQRVRQETGEGMGAVRLLEMIETILVYKFGSLTTKELEAMFGLSELKKTKVYQEGFAEGGRDRQIKMLENLLKVRFGRLDQHLSAVIPALLELPDEEASSVLLNSSREEILDRFTPKS